MTITSFNQTHITGSELHNADEDEILLTTISLQRAGLTIDGDGCETTTALNGLLAVPNQLSQHTIAFTCRTPYLLSGLSISGGFNRGALLFRKYRKKK